MWVKKFKAGGWEATPGKELKTTAATEFERVQPTRGAGIQPSGRSARQSSKGVGRFSKVSVKPWEAQHFGREIVRNERPRPFPHSLGREIS
jgi:hypothetical protein